MRGLDSWRDDVVDGGFNSAAAWLFVLPVAFDQVQEHAEWEQGALPAVQVQVAVSQIGQPREGFGPSATCGCAGQAFGEETSRRMPASKAAVIASL